MAALPAPVRVSPLIKASRWSFLVLGIMWGASRHRSITKKEISIREYEAKQKVIRDAQKAVEKNRANRSEMLYMAKESGVKIPADFDQRYPPT
uniref:ATP synthase F(0) complex subunit e, mitochondrial n=1 Tax=Strigamia maritima TaxID=126957 RepID=T1IW48_STRMM